MLNCHTETRSIFKQKFTFKIYKQTFLMKRNSISTFISKNVSNVNVTA